MATQLLNLPVNIPWKLVAVSPDMMDTKALNKRFPYEWRSSLAISAYEPSLEELPDEICDELITYFKITCSITGYQPTAEETEEGYTRFPNVPAERLDQILREYFACYGVLLNAAVFPYDPETRKIPEELSLKDFPHIISIEPKIRDLYQAATESGEILTASNSKVVTDKSFTHTDSSETGVSLTGGFTPSQQKGGPNVQGTLSHKWGSTDQDSQSIQTDASRERRETQGTTTQISQMYNLLTGYHQGTNRTTFLMLPRPHVLQPTDHRTFVQGLRHIEGVQEFMLIVSRPKKIQALCIEAFLETGHFPEHVTIEEPEQEFQTKRVELGIGPIKAHDGIFTRGEKNFIEEKHGFEVDGWQFDPTRGEPGRGGLEQLRKFEDDNADGRTFGASGGKPAMENYNYKTETPDKVIVSAKLRSRLRSDTVFHRLFSVFLRRPKTTTGEPSADVGKLLITSRGLFACIQTVEDCIDVLRTTPAFDLPTFDTSIVDERVIKTYSSLLTRRSSDASREPAIKELLRQIQNAMSTSWRLPSRYPSGKVGFLDSDYFKDQIIQEIPEEQKETYISKIEGLPYEVVNQLGENFTVGEALEMKLSEFARKAGIDMESAKEARRLLLRS